MWRPGDEPIPGYCLERFLGRGNFGEVWLARAPGGTSAALKFIDLSGKNGTREFRGITRVKGIKHANLMPITAIWMLDENGQPVDDRQLQQYDPRRDTGDRPTDTLAVSSQSQPRAGCLVVAMLAGDKNLGERLEECQEEGLPGIPLDELLVYMEEAAKGLDRLNLLEHDLGDGPTRIQHCDIKPANMMLVGGAVLICDFGLAQVLGDSHVSQSITGSPAFMAPECFEKGGTSTNRDQYALAVAYHELRTGALPFDDESYGAVRDAHAKGSLNLSRLPEAEQRVIRRATSPRPSDRYASSTEMVQALKRAAHPGAARATSGPPVRRLAGVAVLACLVIAAGVAAWPWLASSRSVELSFVPEDAQVRIDGKVQSLDNGRLTLPLSDGQTVRIRVSHDSGWYNEIDQEFTKDQLARRDYQLQLHRFTELQFRPANVQVRVNDVGQTLRDGKLRLLLDDEATVRITASDPEGMYQTLDQLYSAQELRGQGLRIELRPSAKNHVQAAYRLYDEGTLDQARARFRAAVELGHATSVRTVDLAQQTTGAVRLARLGPRGRWMAIASKNTEALFLWDLSAPDPAASALALRAHDDLVNCAEFNGDEHWLVTGGRDKQVRLWDLSQAAAAEPSRILGTHGSDIVAIAVDPAGQRVVSADFAGTIHVWLVETQAASEPAATLPAASEIRDVRLDPSGQWLVALSELGELFRWDMRSDDPLSTFQTLAAPEHEIKCLAFTSDGHRLYAGASGGAVFHWDMKGDQVQPSQTFTGHSDDVESLTVSQDGTLLATGGADRELRVWNPAAGLEQEPRILLGHGHLISALAMGANGRWLVSGSWDKTLRVWDLQSPNPAATCIELDELDDRVRDVATDANRRWLVACGVDGKAMLWDFRELLLSAGTGK